MEEVIAAIILDEDEDDDLLVYCVREGATDILSERNYEGYYSSLIGRYLTDSEMKFREFFSFERHFSVS